MMMYPHQLQCKVTKSRTPSVLNLICYREKNKAAFIFLTKTLTLTITLSTKHRNKLFSCNLIKVISLKMLYISIHFGTDLYQKKYMYVPNAVHTCTFLLTFQFSTFNFHCCSRKSTSTFSSMHPHGLTAPLDIQISASPGSG